MHQHIIATRYYSASDFATRSATKILMNEIIGRKSVSKLPFGIIFRAQISQRRSQKRVGIIPNILAKLIYSPKGNFVYPFLKFE